MSDFTSNFWSLFVAGLTLVSIFACLILLWVTARKKMPARADNTTGHVWDEDLTEMNNPMPRWWMWLFVITIVFALLYLVAYPGLGTYAGELGWSTKSEYDKAMNKAKADLEPIYARFTAMN
jgi:cytochrome c oxidase cbb3-type subunit 3